MTQADLDTRLMAASLESKLFGDERAAVKVGRFVVLERLGQGGMGVVFAVYDDKLDRRVALKLLKGDASADLRLRLQREAQAMAKLSHPNVVPVFEVGEHEEQLFIVLEFVRGQTLGKWVEDDKPSFAEIVDKYIQAGRGLAAAHAEGIVHRDFKPANAIVGAAGRVRVLDFGLARKHTEVSAAELEVTIPSSDDNMLDTPLTETGSIVGTPAYMAPEQFRGEPADHRTDQFAFCVSLWEAVSGSRPFAGRTRNEVMIRVSEGTLSAPERPFPSWLRRLLERGLQVEPNDRWPSMTALVAALERGTARRSSWAVGGGVVAAATVIGAFAWVASRDETDPCVDGRAILANVWDDARRTALREAIHKVPVGYATDTAQRVDEVLGQYADDWIAGHRDACEATSVRRVQSDAVKAQRMQCLDDRKRSLAATVDVLETADVQSLRKAAESVAQLPRIDRCADLDYVAAEEPPVDDPALTAEHSRLLDAIAQAQALQRAGRYTESLEIAERTLETARAMNAASLILRAATAVANAQFSLSKYDASIAAALEGFVVADDGPRRSAATNLLILGHALYRGGRYSEALAHARRALAILTRAGPDDVEIARVHVHIGEALQGQGKLDEAREQYDKALGLSISAVGEMHVYTALAHRHLGGVLEVQGDYAQGQRHAERAVEILTTVLGEDHPDVAAAHVALGIKLSLLRREQKAQDHYAKALEIQERAYGPDHAEIGTTHHNFALSLEHQGKYREAIERYQRALDIWRRSFGEEHPHVATAHSSIGGVHMALGDHDAARSRLDTALGIQAKTLGDKHPDLAGTLASLGGVLTAQGDYDGALAHLQRALAIETKAYGELHPYIASDRNALAEVLNALGRHDEAVDQSTKALAIWESRPPEGSKAAWAHLGLAFGLSSKGDWEAALAQLEVALPAFVTMLGKEHPDLARPAAALVMCAAKLGRPGVGLPALERLRELAGRKEQPPYVAALLATAEATHHNRATEARRARARLQELALTSFVGMLDAWLRRRSQTSG